jgi:hypothetical protein
MVISTFCDWRNSPYNGLSGNGCWSDIARDPERFRMRDCARFLRVASHGIGACDARDYQASNRQSYR